jgi:hypothetical protein
MHAYGSMLSFLRKHPKKFIFFSTGMLCLFYLFTVGKVNSNLGDYAPQTESILAGRAFYSSDGVLLDSYPPIQPLILAGLTRIAEALGVFAIKVIVFYNILCYSITATVIYEIGVLMKIRKAIVLSLILGVANPLILFLISFPASEVTYMLFYALSVLQLSKIFDSSFKKVSFVTLVGAGVWFGFGWITRPISIFIPFCAVASILFFSKNHFWYYAKSAFIILISAFIVITPWQIFTFKESGKFFFLSSRGVNGLRDGLSYNSPLKTFRSKFEFSEDVDSMLQRFQANYEGYRQSSQVIGFLKNELENNPITVLKYYSIKAGRVFYGTDAHKQREETIIKFITFPFFISYIISIFYFYKRRNEYPVAFKVCVFTLLATLSVWALATIATSIVRYMTPIILINSLPVGGLLYSFAKEMMLLTFNKRCVNSNCG